MRGPSNALGQVESSDAHDGHVTRLVSLRSTTLCKCLGWASARRTGHLVGLRPLKRIQTMSLTPGARGPWRVGRRLPTY